MLGECNCGEVKVEVTGQLPGLYQCHCHLCRKQGGSSSNTATLVDKQQFKWLSGELSVKRWRKSSGFSSFFCMHCGSTVPNPLRDSEYIWLPMGLFEHVESEIVAYIYCDDKASYTRLHQGIRQFASMPTVEEFVAVLNQGI